MAINPIHFSPGGVDITLTPTAAPQAVGLALANNDPLPDKAFTDEAIALGSIGASASKEFKLDKVKFNVGGSGFAGFGVYRSGAKLLAALKAEGLDDPMVDDTLFPEDQTKNLYALRWGYGFEGGVSVSGNVALGVGVSLGASGQAERLYALVRSIDRGAKSFDAISDTINSWKLPRKVSTADDLNPGTWLIVETEGSFKANLGLEYGYNYNWVREGINLGGLNGDIGFKIDLGVQAKLGFSASGRYATVVSRDSDRNEIRLRVYRMKQKGWSFAFDASVGAKLEQTLIPDNFEDFIKGVFNVNGQQVLKDIVDTFDKWTNPNNKLEDLLGKELVDSAFGLVKDVTGVDPAEKIDEAIGILKGVVERWRGLPHEVTSVIYGILRDKLPLDDLRDFLKEVKAQADPKKLADAIEEKIREAKFFETAIGKWLTATADKGITTLLANIEDSEVFKGFQDIVDKTLGLLDGSTVESALKKLQEEIEKRLGLDKILAVVDKASFDNLDAWLKKRLSDFLGETIVLKKAQAIVNAINKLRGDNVAKRFYEKGFKALTDKYTAEFHFSYQKTTTKTALIDVTFDFDENAASAKQQLKKALQGDFGDFLSEPTAGVRLNKGVLTHGMNRRSHIEVNLPFFRSVADHITDSLATGTVENAVNAEDGKLWVFNLNATDTVSKRHALNKLAVTLQFSRKPGLRQFSDEQFTYSSTLRMTRRAARREFVEDKIGLVVNEYLASEFNAPGKQPFPEYLTALDKALDDKGVTGDNNLGNLLAGFDVSLPSTAFAAWRNVSDDRRHKSYIDMSTRVQALLRRLIPLFYINDRDKYKELPSMYPLLVYSALPAFNRFKFSPVSGNVKIDTQEAYEWDVRDDATRVAFMNSSLGQVVADNLRNNVLPRVRAEMSSMSEQGSYDNGRIPNMMSLANTGSNSLAKSNFISLVDNERSIINGIRDAALRFRKSLDNNDLEKAIADLDKFGAGLVDTFNNKVGDSRYVGVSFRPLGALLFAEVTTLFDKTVAKTKTTAMLELITLKDTAAFDPDDYLTGDRPETTDVAIQERIISTGT